MNFWTVLFLAAIIIVTLILILFPKSRVLFKGLMNLAFTDLATTPEGAKAIYGEKIEEAQDAYNKADNALGYRDSEEYTIIYFANFDLVKTFIKALGYNHPEFQSRPYRKIQNS